MKLQFVIKGSLPSLNEMINADRFNKYAGNRLKRDKQTYIEFLIRQQLPHCRATKPVLILYTYYEPNRKRDHDNVAGFAHKVIQDALVSTQVLQNDGWKNIIGSVDVFYLDRENPRIVVDLIETDDQPRIEVITDVGS